MVLDKPPGMVVHPAAGHSGGTLGFQTRLIVDLTRKRSVVAWINGQGESVTDLVGMARAKRLLPSPDTPAASSGVATVLGSLGRPRSK